MKLQQELVELLAKKGVEATWLCSILYEAFVRMLENEEDDVEQLEEIVDTISDFRNRHSLY